MRRGFRHPPLLRDGLDRAATRVAREPGNPRTAGEAGESPSGPLAGHLIAKPENETPPNRKINHRQT